MEKTRHPPCPGHIDWEHPGTSACSRIEPKECSEPKEGSACPKYGHGLEMEHRDKAAMEPMNMEPSITWPASIGVNFRGAQGFCQGG